MKWARRRALEARIFGGAWLNMGSPDAAEIAGLSNFDWVLIDLEHGSRDYKDLMHQLQAIGGYETAAIVRVPGIDADVFKQVLDLGPIGLMIPNVQTVEQAETLLRYARVPPLGERGAATSTRNSSYGLYYERYISEVNDNLLLVAQIESAEGLENVEAIAAVDGIDVLFVGPTDLSIALDLENDPTAPNFAEVLKRVASAAKAHGKLAGALVRNQEQAQQYFDLGYRFIALGSDRSMVVRGMTANAGFLAELGAGK
jgi:4-hydroxy-2-oxoheptanedioate aldolase